MTAAVVFKDFKDSTPISIYRKKIVKVHEYIPGSFYKRELPCIISLLADIKEKIDTIIIDGYVFLRDKPGLGAYLKERIEVTIIIIGVAKSYFKGSDAIKIFRGKSLNPLYISSSGIDPKEAALLVSNMHGKHRMPTLLKQVDQLTKIPNKLLQQILFSNHPEANHDIQTNPLRC